MGAARNGPRDHKLILPGLIVVTEDQVQKTLTGLRKVTTRPPITEFYHEPDTVMYELHTVFAQKQLGPEHEFQHIGDCDAQSADSDDGSTRLLPTTMCDAGWKQSQAVIDHTGYKTPMMKLHAEILERVRQLKEQASTVQDDDGSSDDYSSDDGSSDDYSSDDYTECRYSEEHNQTEGFIK